MVDYIELSGLAVALLLAGVAALATVAAYITEGRGDRQLILWLVVIWLLACVLAFTITPTAWPNRTV